MALKNQKGFSLVELMIVVAIIGILSAIALPNFKRFQYKAMQSEAKNQLAAMYTAEKAFYSEWSQYYSDMRNIGYTPDGRLKYRIGFLNGNGTNAPSNYTGAGVAAGGGVGVNFSTDVHCTSTGTCSEQAVAVGGINPALLAAHKINNATTFTAGAVGDIANTSTLDTWQIDHNKVLTNTAVGFP